MLQCGNVVLADVFRPLKAQIVGREGPLILNEAPMEKIVKPTEAELRKAQAALNALNQAYEYFSPTPTLVRDEKASEYFEYVKAA